jgi:hypothetical protein
MTQAKPRARRSAWRARATLAAVSPVRAAMTIATVVRLPPVAWAKSAARAGPELNVSIQPRFPQ